jgi:hypothetical protein
MNLRGAVLLGGSPPEGKFWSSECDCGWSLKMRFKSDHDRMLAEHIATCEQART